MNVYLMRHGIAEPVHPGGDSQRHLTSEGRTLVADAGQGLNRRSITFDCIVASPYTRAQETTSIVARQIGHSGPILTDNRLVPSGDPLAVSDLIRELTDYSSLLLVFHQPLIDETISMITSAGHLMMRIPPGSITRTSISSFRPHAQGTLDWSIPAEMWGS